MSEHKKSYVERQRENLKSWNSEIDKYQARAEKAGDKMVEKYKKYIVDLKEKHSGLETKVSELEKSAEGAWDEMKVGAEKAFKELDKSFKAAKAYFN